MIRRHIKTTEREWAVFPEADEIVFAGHNLSSEPVIMLREYRGERLFYVFREAQWRYGCELPELCHPISKEEIELEMQYWASEGDCGLPYDEKRLEILGLKVPVIIPINPDEKATA